MPKRMNAKHIEHTARPFSASSRCVSVFFFGAVFVPPCLFWDMNKDFELPKKAHHCYSTHQRHQHQCYCFRLRGKKTIVQFRHNVNIGNSGNIYTCSSGLLLELHHTHTFSSSIFLSFFMGSLFLVSLKLLLFLLLFKIAEKTTHSHTKGYPGKPMIWALRLSNIGERMRATDRKREIESEKVRENVSGTMQNRGHKTDS